MPSTGDHPITLTPAGSRWRARFADHVIADTGDACVLREADYPAVVYFPRGDVAMEYMSRSEHRTRCPYKGEATYFSILMDGRLLENVAWSYEAPREGMEPIAGHIAFYPDKVQVYAVDDARVNPHHRDEPAPDEVVLHTDAGDGRSQRPRWSPNVQTPRDDAGAG